MDNIANSIITVLILSPFFLQIAEKSIESKAHKYRVKSEDLYDYVNGLIFPVNIIMRILLPKYEIREAQAMDSAAKLAEVQGVLYSILPVLYIGVSVITVIERPDGHYALSNLIDIITFPALLFLSWRVGSGFKG